jgi:glyoxylase-like metal-dependent hydrolase (beta-lactamase superfamily II)
MPHPAEGPHTHDLVRGHATVGDFELTICTDGTYVLDGGAMFGVVPKPLWEKRAPADEKNRILLGANTVIVRTGRHTVAIETGLGNKLSPKLRDIYKSSQLLPESLEAAGVRPEEVNVVINSHLHFDHCGWNTVCSESGQIVPMFPNAHYFAHQG